MKIKRKWKEEDGASAVLVILLITVIFSFTALAIDLGSAYNLKVRIQSACDLAALAGAKKLPDTCAVLTAAKENAAKNGFREEDVSVSVLGAADKVRVSIKNDKPTFFARVMGINSLEVSCQAVAAYEEMSFDEDFEYAIFSGDPDADLNMGWGNYWVDGKVHANGTVTTGGYVYADKITSDKGGDLKYNTFITSRDATGEVETERKNGEVDHAEVVEMPYYLGDNIDALIVEPSLPSNDYWVNTVTTSRFDDTALYDTLKKNQNTHIKTTGTPNGYMNQIVNFEGDLYLDLNSDVSIQFFSQYGSNETDVINGDIYITNPGHTTGMVNYGNGFTVNGNIYVMSGNLNLANAAVNGNIYCVGNMTTDGGLTQIRAKYVYANSLKTGNSTDINATIITEYDAEVMGGSNGVYSSSTLSAYSRHGNIKFGTNYSDIHGYIFAPYGDIDIVANNEIYGKIIGNTVSMQSGNVKVHPLDKELDFEIKKKSESGEAKRKARLIQ